MTKTRWPKTKHTLATTHILGQPLQGAEKPLRDSDKREGEEDNRSKEQAEETETSGVTSEDDVDSTHQFGDITTTKRTEEETHEEEQMECTPIKGRYVERPAA